MSKFNSGKASFIALATVFVALVVTSFLFIKFSTLVDASEKVKICHSGNGKNWVEVKVDKNAWNEHSSAHSDHRHDFLIDGDNPCPPEGGDPITCNDELPDELLVVNATRTITNSPDSGEAGNFWAKDNFTQTMKVWNLNPNSENSRSYCGQTIDNGTFNVIAGQTSPGKTGALVGTENGTFNGSTKIKITGKFDHQWPTSGNVGSFNFDIPAQKIGYGTSPNWVTKYFPSGSFEWLSWSWTYNSCNESQWVNASSGNSGDILPNTGEVTCSTPTPTPTPTATPTVNDVCANIDGVQTSVPEGMHLDASGKNCVNFSPSGPAPRNDEGTGTGGQVLGASTIKGQVLGASTMAKTGTFEEGLYQAIMVIGGTLSAFGIKGLKKASKKA